jgi:hypothetical protein
MMIRTSADSDLSPADQSFIMDAGRLRGVTLSTYPTHQRKIRQFGRVGALCGAGAGFWMGYVLSFSSFFLKKKEEKLRTTYS